LTREWNLRSMNWRAVGSFLSRTCIFVGKIEISGLKAVQQFPRLRYMCTCCKFWVHVRIIPPVAQLCSRMSLFIQTGNWEPPEGFGEKISSGFP
jgi:hypothetical protein